MTSMASARTTAAQQPETPQLGLRERKKIQNRQAIRRAAYRLFAEQGYDATPVEQIAEAAEVSPSTVFRYFATKEDIVLTDEQDPLLEAGLRARPAGEPVLESLRHVVLDVLGHLAATERTELVQRTRLAREVPVIRGRTAEQAARDADMLAAVLAERAGREADSLEIRVICVAVMAAVDETLWQWVTSGQEQDLLGLVNRTMDLLAGRMKP
ncbi:TetR family transcriptional regulator [Streptomyces sp. HU2014]|uniref:TetR/AcrR family transcriptional regulator n=1 Tax=Streptomyces sp. HU2014 TaxID=2939414 RepID=UPI00200CF0EF|nr:TetR/AcrR family transcriptional regulator [Streptomyces sp. HU2014]UQI46098.1 TetR family transcriptional regulator [Streptomyces sp. HU2014]